MTSTQTQALDPCPFCGEVLEIRSGVNPYGRHGKDSECIMAGRAINIPIDVERWNRRAALPTEAPEPVLWTDVGYLMSIIDSAIEDGFDPDEDGPLLDQIRAQLKTPEAVADRLAQSEASFAPATVSSAVPVAFIVHDDPELGDYLTKSRQAADASGKRVTPLYAEPLQNPQQLDRAAIIEECAKVADDAAREFQVASAASMSIGGQDNRLAKANGARDVAGRIRSLIGGTK